MPFKNRIRLPFYLSKPQFPMERSVFRKANGETKVLSVVVRSTYQGETDYLPADWHRKLAIALAHDQVTIEGDKYIGNVALDGDYQIDWQEFLDYPAAKSTFQIQVTPFNATNSNCVSCSQISQLSLEDDTVPGEIGDGGEAEINVFDNDSICCYPPVAELVYVNESFIENANITNEGIFSFNAINPVPSESNVKIATYRVTCEDGSYDEADVYASFNGSGEATCCQPSGLDYNEELNLISWLTSCEPSGGFNYDFRLASNPGVPIFSGNVAGDIIGINVPPEIIEAPGDYIFTIYADCGATQSDTSTLNFTIESPAGECYGFDAGYNAVTGPANAIFSYMNCAGDVVNTSVARFTTKRVCALVDESNNPVFWSADQPSTTFVPASACGLGAVNISNELIVGTINDVDGISGYTFGGSLLPGDSTSGTHASFSGIISFDVSGSGIEGFGCLQRNGIPIDSVPILGVGSYDFLSHSFSATDSITIIFTSTECPVE